MMFQPEEALGDTRAVSHGQRAVPTSALCCGWGSGSIPPHHDLVLHKKTNENLVMNSGWRRQSINQKIAEIHLINSAR